MFWTDQWGFQMCDVLLISQDAPFNSLSLDTPDLLRLTNEVTWVETPQKSLNFQAITS